MIRLALAADGTEQKVLLQALSGVAGVELRYLIGQKGEVPIGEARSVTLDAALDDAAVDGLLFGSGSRPEAVEQAIRAGKAVWVPRRLLGDRRRLDHLAGLLEAQPIPMFVPFLRRFDEVLHHHLAEDEFSEGRAIAHLDRYFSPRLFKKFVKGHPVAPSCLRAASRSERKSPAWSRLIS